MERLWKTAEFIGYVVDKRLVIEYGASAIKTQSQSRSRPIKNSTFSEVCILNITGLAYSLGHE
jgi:hypothetical protein